MERGQFIAFEGPDGSGKTTQSRLLTEHLTQQGVPVIYAREPGQTELGQLIRSRLLSTEDAMLPPTVQLCFFETARWTFLERVVKPALDEGTHVICDRHTLSTEIYQGYVQDVDMKIINKIHSELSSLATPDITIVIDAPVRVAQQRVWNFNRPDRPDPFELQKRSFQLKVRKGYLRTALLERNLPIIDGTKSVGEVHQEILNHVMPLFTPQR